MMQSRRSDQTRFLLQFGATAGILLVSFHAVEAVFGTLYLLPISWSAATLLDLMGIPAVFDAGPLAQGYCVVETLRTVFEVRFECTGLFSLFIYLAAVVAYPASGDHKIRGVAFGLPAFFSYSVLRLVVIGAIDHLVPLWLDWFHIYFMVLLNLGFFLFIWAIWVNRWDAATK
ncbi:MAG: hypothetical protein HN712_01775 [Gemmatimonadetes bacterium]|jgi:exosortase/archaeosortase family protein|nr:hypothetical protein [Gemmatimonadota bacterium]MBT7859003.1 hypothetical protein [Gemmatimonadota bacterium]